MPEAAAVATTGESATDSMRAYLEAFESVAARRAASEPGRLGILRREAITRFQELGFPTKRLEEWRSTDVRPIARAEFGFESGAEGTTEAQLEAFRYAGTCELVLVNGTYREDLSRIPKLPEGVVVSSLARAWADHPDLVEPHLGNHAKFEHHAFVALNTALHEDGVFVFVPRGVIVDVPIHVLHIGYGKDGDAKPVASFPRNLFVAAENSQCRVIEQYATASDMAAGNTLASPVTEVVLEANAVVDHYKLQRESIDAFHMATFQIHLERASNFSSQSISWGGGLVRNDVNAVLDGEGCEATLNGLYMVEGTQLVDNHMRVDHVAPHCDSHELFKGILEGSARAVFNGRIFVHKGAQKTDAKQTNRNLLLSPKALVNSNPQLEIFADDVRCTHGSTVGQLDELGVFYLRSRGIGEQAARSLLTYAFAADIVQRIKDKAVRRDLEEFLFRRLPRGEVVRQAV